MNNMTCRYCGGALRPRNIRGESWPYRDEPEVEVTGDFHILTCSECGEGSLNEEEIDALDAVLDQSYSDLRIHRQTEMIQSLVQRYDLRQADIERLLGVSSGYLSKAQHQGKVLSPTTYRLLYLLVRNPYEIAHELAKLDAGLTPLVEHLDRVQHPAFAV